MVTCKFYIGQKVIIKKFNENRQWDFLNFMRGKNGIISEIYCLPPKNRNCFYKEGFDCWECAQQNIKLEETNDMSWSGSLLDKPIYVLDTYEGGAIKMNDNIVRLFPRTVDALLIEKHFGSIDTLQAVLLKGMEDELLQEAKRLDAVEGKEK